MKNKNSDTAKNRLGMVCPHCNAKIPYGNFCAECGKKIVSMCNCWKLNRSFNCGHDECPTMGALIKEFGYSLFPS